MSETSVKGYKALVNGEDGKIISIPLGAWLGVESIKPDVIGYKKEEALNL